MRSKNVVLLPYARFFFDASPSSLLLSALGGEKRRGDENVDLYALLVLLFPISMHPFSLHYNVDCSFKLSGLNLVPVPCWL